MAELHLNIVECKYPNTVQDELLKDQFIFGVCVKEVQDYLQGEITPEDNSDKCLLEAHKVENKIEQHKLLGIKMSMTYAIQSSNRGRSKSKNKNQGCSQSKVQLGTVNIVGKAMTVVIAQHLVRNIPNVVERITLKLCVKVVQNVTNPGPRRGLKRAKSSMRSMRLKIPKWMICKSKCSHYFIMMYISIM